MYYFTTTREYSYELPANSGVEISRLSEGLRLSLRAQVFNVIRTKSISRFDFRYKFYELCDIYIQNQLG